MFRGIRDLYEETVIEEGTEGSEEDRKERLRVVSPVKGRNHDDTKLTYKGRF